MLHADSPLTYLKVQYLVLLFILDLLVGFSHGISFHDYADDTQIILFFPHSGTHFHPDV